MRILCIGDICGDGGMNFAAKTIGGVKKLYNTDFVIANGENAQGRGILPRDCERLYGAGVDVITLGNHAYGRDEILPYIDGDRYLLRPANFTSRSPGNGYGVFDAPKARQIAVINLAGRLSMDSNSDNPFFTCDTILKNINTPFIIVDMHAEATSEKLALLHYLDGRVSAIFGTHTHVPTADAQVTRSGTGYITDAGMCGPKNSILGIKPEASLARFLGEPWRGNRQADGDCALQGVLFELNDTSGRCVSAERVEVE